MPRRHILTERQRKTLLDIPTDEASLLRHDTLADDDLEYIQTRRRAHNCFGFVRCASLDVCLPQVNNPSGSIAVSFSSA